MVTRGFIGAKADIETTRDTVSLYVAKMFPARNQQTARSE
jgi:hypothetical protein